MQLVPPSALSEEAKRALWKVFSSGANPFSKLSTLDAAKKILPSLLGEDKGPAVVSIVESWFGELGTSRWLRDEVKDELAPLLIIGAAEKISRKEIWALTAIDSELVLPHIEREIDAQNKANLVDTAIAMIEKQCEADIRVLSDLHSSRYGGKITRDSFRGQTPLERYHLIERHEPMLAHDGLATNVANLVRIVLQLRPSALEEFISRSAHPVVQMYAFAVVHNKARRTNHTAVLDQLHSGSSAEMNALVALEVMTCLRLIQTEISEHTRGGSASYSATRFTTADQLRQGASDFVVEFGTSIADLETSAAIGLSGELLGLAQFIFPADDPNLSVDLEETLKFIIRDKLLTATEAATVLDTVWEALSIQKYSRGHRHLADIAWDIREEHSSLALQIARRILQSHEHETAGWTSDEHRFFLHLDTRTETLWAIGLARCICIANEEPEKYLLQAMKRLPLTRWDVEERYSDFLEAQDIVMLLFYLLSCCAQFRHEEGNALDASKVFSLYDLFLRHLKFVASTGGVPNQSYGLVASNMTKVAIHFGGAGSHIVISVVALQHLPVSALKTSVLHNASVTSHDTTTKLAVEHLTERYNQCEGEDPEELLSWYQIWVALGLAANALSAMTKIREIEGRRGHQLLAQWYLEALESTLILLEEHKNEPAVQKLGMHVLEDFVRACYRGHERIADNDVLPLAEKTRQRLQELGVRLY